MAERKKTKFTGQRPRGVLKGGSRPGLEISFTNVPQAIEKVTEDGSVWVSKTTEGNFVGVDQDRGVRLHEPDQLTLGELADLGLPQEVQDRLKRKGL